MISWLEGITLPQIAPVSSKERTTHPGLLSTNIAHHHQRISPFEETVGECLNQKTSTQSKFKVPKIHKNPTQSFSKSFKPSISFNCLGFPNCWAFKACREKAPLLGRWKLESLWGFDKKCRETMFCWKLVIPNRSSDTSCNFLHIIFSNLVKFWWCEITLFGDEDCVNHCVVYHKSAGDGDSAHWQ